ncbi:MAG TPA: transglutaminase-like domain-containing protein [Alphaproteobacteria bacterium]|jgi:hypothetical protein|nr:transglutaminase-like domain-containing protein [Alphaproteobacteria bacterium]
MKFLKLSLALVLSTLYLVLCTTAAKAENEFSVDSTVTYKVQDSGKTTVTHDITLENNFSTLYATTYTLSLENINAENIKATTVNGSPITVDTQKNGDKTDIKVSFADSVVGKNAKRHFFISYENGSFAVKTGEVWEISIPRLGNQNAFRNYTVHLIVPESFGLEAYMSPQPDTSQDYNGGHTYIFNKNNITQTGITAGFGQFQVFSFNLAYHLENPLARNSETTIAFPPDTAFQKIYLQSIDPKPSNVEVDEDGNWLAHYKLSPRQRIDVNVAGTVQIFAGFRTFPKPTQEVLNNNLASTQYWQADDPQIKELAQQLKTPHSIYNFVATKLNYDYSRVQPNVQRMGAVEALNRPDQAICMEFTDLFIAIARAAGIPAREINGYAYTENPQLQPLSLVADVLHSWPEYYDKEKGVWIPIDPTWGSTTGGVDFFNKLDLRHFTFVIHGKDATKPYAPGSYKLGPNPQKDIFVSFGKLPQDRTSIPQISGNLKTVKIENPGPVALYGLYPSVYFDDKEKGRDFISILPPYSIYNMPISIPFSLLGKDTPDIVTVKVQNSQFQIPTNKKQVVINSLVIIFVLFLAILIFILYKRYAKKLFAKAS